MRNRSTQSVTCEGGRNVTPLSDLPVEMQERIREQVAQPRPPAKVITFRDERGRPLAQMPSRAWYEWHWARGIDPDKARKSLPPSIRRFVLERDGRHCGICDQDIADEEPIDIDHIHPVALGGTDNPDNLQVAHASCNRSKGARV